jgi:hypothetical protein
MNNLPYMLFFRVFALVFSVVPAAVSAQVLGGRHSFSFLELSPSARVTALGGSQIAVRDDEVAFAALNPAAANPLMSGRLTFNHNFYLTDIQHGYAAYAHELKKTGFTLHGGVQYTDYGDIPQADETGVITGKVTAKETAVIVGGARQLSDKLSLGLNLKWAASTLDAYNAHAIAADAGLLYADTARNYSIGVVLRNYGAQVNTYNGVREDLPNDIQVAFSKRLKYLPFRFTIIAHQLQQWQIRYDDPALQQSEFISFTGEEQKKSGSPVVDNFFRHMIFNGEFLLGKHEGFRLRVGYNHLRKRELSVNNYRSLAGFSAGVGVKVSRFRVDFGYSVYHLAGGVVHLGIGTNLREFF